MLLTVTPVLVMFDIVGGSVQEVSEVDVVVVVVREAVVSI